MNVAIILLAVVLAAEIARRIFDIMDSKVQNDTKIRSPSQQNNVPTSGTVALKLPDKIDLDLETNLKPKTRWVSIGIAAVILFLVSVQFSVYFSSLWPYLSRIDTSASQTFYGFTLAAYSFGQMVASPLFGYWNAKVKRARVVIAVGVCFSIVGNLIYMFTEASPTDRKWMILCGRFLCGISGGIAGTVRGYVATASTREDQHRAVSIGSVAWSLGIAGGPFLQFALTPIGYPGYTAGPLHFNEYTAAAYVSILAALILMLLLITVFEENYIGVDDRKTQDQFHYVPKADLKAAALLMICWFAAFFNITNMDAVESPYTMANFNWTTDDAVFYNSIIMSVSFGLSVCIYVGYTIFGKRINERVSILVGLCFLFGFYVFTFSWSFYTGQLDFKHSTPAAAGSIGNTTVHLYGDTSNLQAILTTTEHQHELVGCDTEMEWCNYTPRLPMPVYLAAYPLLSFGHPMCSVSIATLFAKILGPRRQGFMQSMMITTGSLARTLGPILISWLFSTYGPRIAWTLTCVIMAIAIFSVMIGYNRLVPHKMRPKLRGGQKLQYDGGKLYRF